MADSDSSMEEYSFVNSICEGMDPTDILLSITLECPHDSKRRSCPIKEVEEWRKLGLQEVRTKIQSLPPHVKKELVEKHRHCSCMLSDHKMLPRK